MPVESNNYYKTGFGNEPIATMAMLPNGLMMVAGNVPSNTNPDNVPNTWDFTCTVTDVVSVTIPDCPVGSDLIVRGNFDNCWDGLHYDSPNHRSHMSTQQEDGYCPSSHPVSVVRLGINVHYQILPGMDTTTWKLSCDLGAAGLCSHADVRIHWDPQVAEDWMNNCVRNGGSCQNNTNAGYELYSQLAP